MRWLPLKPADQDLQCSEERVNSGLAGQRLKGGYSFMANFTQKR